jgi:PPK2 family polyphosphate:nucleotide phosphotransferase
VYGTRIEPGANVSLKALKTRSPGRLSKEDGKARLAELARELGELQKLLYSAGTHSLLVVFQGMDTSGKDSSIREAFAEVNPTGITVTPFKVPTEEELAHDFLWRIHQHTPESGQIAIFNRSHYEDVVVVRVRKLVPRKVWAARYDRINAFEQLLAENNTIICKVFLHVSKDEQERRLLDREADLTDAWKLSVNDWYERDHWGTYQQAYEDAIGKCSTRHAPWHVIPADQKWYRNLAVAEAIVRSLRPYRKSWVTKLEAEARTQLDAIAEARKQGRIPEPPPAEIEPPADLAEAQ